MADLLTLQREVHQIARDHGWWDDEEQANIPTKIALMHSELSEALEEYRSDKMDLYYAPGRIEIHGEGVYEAGEGDVKVVTEFTPVGATVKEPKPEGFGVELADTIIRILDLAGFLGLDMAALVELKMEYNRGRPHKHGGRRV